MAGFVSYWSVKKEKHSSYFCTFVLVQPIGDVFLWIFNMFEPKDSKPSLQIIMQYDGNASETAF